MRPLSLPRQIKINNLILDVIVEDVHPFSIINDTGFRKLVLGLAPSYAFPSKTTFSTTFLMEKYNKAKESILDILQEAKTISLTTDMWTSNANESYLAVTAHFISQNWKFNSCLLSCVECRFQHTSENLAAEIKRIIDEWRLTNKIFAVTTDNAANIIRAVTLCGWCHVPCFAHTLNLIIQKGLKNIEHIRLKSKNIAEYFNRSTLANTKLQAQQKLSLNSTVLKLKNDCPTRWNSTCYMFDRIIKITEAISATIGILRIPLEALTENDCCIIKEILNILKPFEQITTEMSSENNVTLSKVINFVRGLNAVLTKLSKEITSIEGKKMADTLKDSISTRFVNLEGNSLMATAAFLDPRVQSEITALINNKSISNERLCNESRSTSRNDDEDLVWQDFNDSLVGSQTQTPTALPIIEIRMYLEEPLVDRKSNPLEWWKQRALLYPHLSELARKYLYQF
ncbi:zinc finger BED domain-containing protein 4-like [Teleopsis dalmanni]|uniref:zinc finger BED domain-containing protein 4-like n=1 Tax=Teleopsis dalmanni TaxID=139649 RepID=UPI0018CCFE78|nr:zinc finger BED domain-containing protein 4-like [Teleopsis dalmanni]